MPDFYIESYTGLKWVKREHSLTQVLNLLCQNISQDIFLSFLVGPKIQAKIPSPSGDCVLGDSQLDTLPLMVKG